MNTLHNLHLTVKMQAQPAEPKTPPRQQQRTHLNRPYVPIELPESARPQRYKHFVYTLGCLYFTLESAIVEYCAHKYGKFTIQFSMAFLNYLKGFFLHFRTLHRSGFCDSVFPTRYLLPRNHDWILRHQF